MNYFTDRAEEIRNAQRVYLMATDDDYYEECETTGRLYIDEENRHFVFVADGKALAISTEYDLYEIVTEDGMTDITLETMEHFYTFVDKEEMDRATRELLIAGGMINE